MDKKSNMKKECPLVSIIIPVFNVYDYIEKCIVSVINQTYNNLQIIIIDDCGEDCSVQLALDILNSSVLRDKYILIKHAINLGLSAARNTGIKNSTGELLYFLDSDDCLSYDCIEKLMTFYLNNDNVQMVFGNYCVSKGNMFSINKLEEGIYENCILDLFCNKQLVTMSWNKLISKDFLLNNNLFFREGLIHEDNLWSFQVASQLKKIAICHAITYYYTIRENSIQNEKNSYIKHQRAFEVVTEEMIKYAFDHNIADKCCVHSFIDEYQRLYFMSPLWNNMPEESRIFYKRLRGLPHLSIFQELKCFLGLKKFLSSFHFYLSEEYGFKWYRKLRQNV